MPSYEAAKGIDAVIESVFKMVAARGDLEKGVTGFMIQILLPHGSIILCELSIQDLSAFIIKLSI